MSTKKIELTELDDVKALKLVELHSKEVSIGESRLSIAQTARSAVFDAVENEEYVALSKAFRAFGARFEHSLEFEVSLGDAIGTNILEINGESYAASTLFIPINYVLDPQDFENPAVNDLGFKKALPAPAVKQINAFMKKKYPESIFHLTSFLLDRDEVINPSQKRKIEELSRITSMYHAEKVFNQESSVSKEVFAKFLVENFDLDRTFDLSEGSSDIKFAICNILERLPDGQPKAVSPSTVWNTPYQLMTKNQDKKIKESKVMIREFSKALQSCLDQIEEVSVIGNVLPPQSYCLLDYTVVLTNGFNVLSQARTLIEEIDSCDIVIGVENSSSISLMYEFKSKNIDDGEPPIFNYVYEYIPFRFMYPIREIELMQSFFKKVFGIDTKIIIKQ